MCNIVSRGTELHADWANVWSGTWTVRVWLDLIPKSIEISTSSPISNNSIKRISHPVASHSDITLQHCERSDRTDHQIILDDVVGLYPILNKNVVALDSISYILLHQQVICCVDC